MVIYSLLSYNNPKPIFSNYADSSYSITGTKKGRKSFKWWSDITSFSLNFTRWNLDTPSPIRMEKLTLNVKCCTGPHSENIFFWIVWCSRPVLFLSYIFSITLLKSNDMHTDCGRGCFWCKMLEERYLSTMWWNILKNFK